MVSFGHPISLDPKDIEDFKAGGKAKRDAITKVLDKGDEAFKTVTVNTPDYETLMVRKYRVDKEGSININYFMCIGYSSS